jgi:hypothetical protein
MVLVKSRLLEGLNGAAVGIIQSKHPMGVKSLIYAG